MFFHAFGPHSNVVEGAGLSVGVGIARLPFLYLSGTYVLRRAGPKALRLAAARPGPKALAKGNTAPHGCRSPPASEADAAEDGCRSHPASGVAYL